MSVYCLLPTAHAPAQPTQEDVFRSISTNVSQPSNGGGAVLAVVAGVIGLLVLVAAISNRRSRPASPRVLLSHGKLLKEVMRSIPLRPAELKQLKLLADTPGGGGADGGGGGGGDAPLESPLTLLLCPSVLARAAKNPRARLNRRLLAQIARKLGVPARR